MSTQSSSQHSLASLLSPTYTPTSPSDFIGPARTAAIIIDKTIAARSATHQAMKFCLIGPPGVGKSALCKYFWKGLSQLSPCPCGTHSSVLSSFDLHKLAGKDVDLERVREISQAIQYQPISPYRLWWIDEADCMTPDALKRMLPMLDELPARNAIILTANSSLTKIEERFHTRFKPLELTGPSAGEIFDFLLPFVRSVLSPQSSILPPTQIRTLKQIAADCGGNVRAAIDDLDTYLLTQ